MVSDREPTEHQAADKDEPRDRPIVVENIIPAEDDLKVEASEHEMSDRFTPTKVHEVKPFAHSGGDLKENKDDSDHDKVG
jgi:hypothetical protein